MPESLHGAEAPRLGDFLRGAVELLPVGIAVGVDPDTARVDDRGALAGLHVVQRRLRGPPAFKYICPVAVDDLHRLEAREILPDVLVRGLLLDRHRNPEFVILDDEDYGKDLPCRAAHRLIDETL